MRIEFKYLEDGTLMSYDKDTGQELGPIVTMGDQIIED